MLCDGEYRQLTPTEMREFEQNFPEIAKYWLEPDAEHLDSLTLPKSDSIQYESWD